MKVTSCCFKMLHWGRYITQIPKTQLKFAAYTQQAQSSKVLLQHIVSVTKDFQCELTEFFFFSFFFKSPFVCGRERLSQSADLTDDPNKKLLYC